jgi:hypothetical protein
MRLLVMSDAEIISFIDSLEQSAKALRKETLTVCWYMRGGVTYDEAMMLSNEERLIIRDIIKDNMETTKKSGLPFF